MRFVGTMQFNNFTNMPFSTLSASRWFHWDSGATTRCHRLDRKWFSTRITGTIVSISNDGHHHIARTAGTCHQITTRRQKTHQKYHHHVVDQTIASTKGGQFNGRQCGHQSDQCSCWCERVRWEWGSDSAVIYILCAAENPPAFRIRSADVTRCARVLARLAECQISTD